MTIEINSWIEDFRKKIFDKFGTRVLFMGLQGSYNRQEATPNSDIDVVLILDNVDIKDLKQYRQIVQSMPEKEKICGFISGKEEIENWTKNDIFQFLYDTKPIYGDIFDIVKKPDRNDIILSVKTGAQNIYHGACHSFLFDKEQTETIKCLYKNTFFVLQAMFFLKTGEYVSTKKSLLEKLDGKDKEILQICIDKEKIENYTNTDNLYDSLIKWSKNIIKTDF